MHLGNNHAALLQPEAVAGVMRYKCQNHFLLYESVLRNGGSAGVRKNIAKLHTRDFIQ